MVLAGHLSAESHPPCIPPVTNPALGLGECRRLRSWATQSGAQALAAIQKTAPELLAKHGLDDDSLIEKHLIPLMNAEETKFFTLPVGKGKDRRLQIESRKTANWSARQNGLDMAFKIRGLYVREQENRGPEFSVVMIDASNRPDWAAMRRTQPKIEVPGLPAHVPKPLELAPPR